jgi:hypothetical protein
VFVAAIETSLFAAQFTCLTRPTTNTHAIAPTINTPVVIAMAATKLPQDKKGSNNVDEKDMRDSSRICSLTSAGTL